MTDGIVTSSQDRLGVTGLDMDVGRPGWKSAAIVAHDRLLGWVCLLEDVGDASGDREWLAALEKAVSMVTPEHLRLQPVVDPEAASLRELAGELIADPTSARVRGVAEELRYQLGRQHRVLAVRVPDAVEVGGAERGMLAEQVLRKLNVQSPLVAEHGGRLFLVLPCDNRVTDDEQAFLEDLVFLEDLAGALANTLGSDIEAGVGGYYEVPQLKRSLDEAVFALEIRESLHPKERFTTFHGLGFWKVIHDTGATLELRRVVNEWIGKLIRHDAAQRSELVKTLSVYLNESCTIESAATTLFVHRNTLRYRLTKIAQIIGRDLSDPEQRFQLELACRAWEMLQVLDAADMDFDRAVSPVDG